MEFGVSCLLAVRYEMDIIMVLSHRLFSLLVATHKLCGTGLVGTQAGRHEKSRHVYILLLRLFSSKPRSTGSLRTPKVS